MKRKKEKRREIKNDIEIREKGGSSRFEFRLDNFQIGGKIWFFPLWAWPLQTGKTIGSSATTMASFTSARSAVSTPSPSPLRRLFPIPRRRRTIVGSGRRGPSSRLRRSTRGRLITGSICRTPCAQWRRRPINNNGGSSMSKRRCLFH